MLSFTDRKSTAPLLKALSLKFKGKMMFGEVKKGESFLRANFKMENKNGLMVIIDQFDFKGDLYEGEMKYKGIYDFLRKYAFTNEKTIAKGQTNVKTLNTRTERAGLCDKKDHSYCVIYFSSGGSAIDQ